MLPINLILILRYFFINWKLDSFNNPVCSNLNKMDLQLFLTRESNFIAYFCMHAGLAWGIYALSQWFSTGGPLTASGPQKTKNNP